MYSTGKDSLNYFQYKSQTIKFIKLLLPVIIIAILIFVVKPLLANITCLQSGIICDLNPTSNYAFLFSFYGLLTGHQILLIAQLLLFAVLGLSFKNRQTLLWSFVVYAVMEFIRIVWVLYTSAYQDNYLIPDNLILFFIKFILLSGMFFTLTAVIFSLSGDSIPQLQRFRQKIADQTFLRKLIIIGIINLIVVFL